MEESRTSASTHGSREREQFEATIFDSGIELLYRYLSVYGLHFVWQSMNVCSELQALRSLPQLIADVLSWLWQMMSSIRRQSSWWGGTRCRSMLQQPWTAWTVHLRDKFSSTSGLAVWQELLIENLRNSHREKVCSAQSSGLTPLNASNNNYELHRLAIVVWEEAVRPNTK